MKFQDPPPMHRTILGYTRIFGPLVGLVLVASCGESATDTDGSGGSSSGGSGGGSHSGGSSSIGGQSSGGTDGESGGGGLGGAVGGLGGATGGEGGSEPDATGGAPSTAGCSGTPTTECSELMGPACAMAGCTQEMGCSGEAGCEDYEMPMACDMAPEDCTWGGTCSGEVTPCSERTHEPECQQVDGCVWIAP